MKFTLTLNGRKTVVDADDPNMPLLYALRNDAGLHGPRFGCGLGQCGACTVHVDGKAARSCPVQQAFIDEQAVQCGYCINGMVMQAAALLAVNRKPTDAQIREALEHNLCRCGTHTRIMRAVRRASDQMA